MCPICYQTPVYPVRCNQCNNWFCKKCYLGWTSGNEKCPMKCSKDEVHIEDLSLERQVSNMYKFQQCMICNANVLAANYQDHCNLHEISQMCFNY